MVQQVFAANPEVLKEVLEESTRLAPDRLFFIENVHLALLSLHNPLLIFQFLEYSRIASEKPILFRTSRLIQDLF
jgi:hypothetical protein